MKKLRADVKDAFNGTDRENVGLYEQAIAEESYRGAVLFYDRNNT